MIKFNQTPHPQIEDHYHIQELIKAQERRHEDRKAWQEKVKTSAERDTMIAEADRFKIVDFWCDECKVDFIGQAVKQVEGDWNADQRVAFYKTKCFRGHWCIRFITDKWKDGFYYKSKLMSLDRGNHFADTVQPFETGYNMLYGKR